MAAGNIYFHCVFPKSIQALTHFIYRPAIPAAAGRNLENGADLMKIKPKCIFAAAVLIFASVLSVSCSEIDSDISVLSGEIKPNTGTAAENTLQNSPAYADGKKSHSGAFTVVIDPGHGFDDPGSHPEFLYSDEADITLKAAKSLETALREKGVKTVLTHNGKSFPTVKEICAAADKYGIEYDEEKMKENNVFSAYERVIYSNVLAREISNCFFVSLHTNSVEDSPSTCGLAIDYYEESPFSTELGIFANDFKAEVRQTLNKDTVIFADNTKNAYIVNKYSTVPSILIEMGYGSNRQDGMDLMNEAWIDKFSGMLAKLIADNKDSF